MKTSRRWLAVVGLLLAAAATAFTVLRVMVLTSTKPINLVDVPAHECPMALPADAQHVTYYDPRGMRASFRNVMFNCNEDAFLAWAARQTRRELTRQEGRMQITLFRVDPPLPSVCVDVENGIRLGWEQGDRSQTFVYDRDARRGLYQETFH